MKNIRLILFHGSRLLLAGIFLYAGVLKAEDPVAFAGQVANYQLLPYAWNYLVAAILPYLEILCGMLLILNSWVRPSTLLLGLLNLVFMVALTSLIVRGIDIDCGCFNPDAEVKTSPLSALIRDLGIMLLVVMTWVLDRRKNREERA
ncbi:MAG TPA: MauE/DoxX family redox-associated membrane protein [Geopsychrobacteraceae bacterium]|nr:MauE/DoxX family redox-associated membrane protein [Geopsychrobacteraceae bacterium]